MSSAPAATATAHVSVEAALQAFVESLAARGSAQTRQRYSRACSALVAGLDGKPLAEVRRHDIQRALARLHASGWGPRTLAVTLSAWRAWFRYLARVDASISTTIFTGIKAPRAPKRLPNALSEAEAVRLVASIDETDAVSTVDSGVTATRDQAMFEVLYGCGIRIGELIGLDVASVDLRAGEMRVFGKGRKERVVPLGAPARRALAAWLDERAKLPVKPSGGEPALFLGQRGDRIGPAVVRRALKARAAERGIASHVYPHRLRHSFASHVLQSSGDLRGVQELMGHASIASTQVYTHLDFQHLAKVYDQAHPRARKKPGSR
ncbi:MAG: tyrosine recombinase XerC [Burkholderiales bacterium]|nr:tyrosine recombinase XerC [Burkholderiales bacterium]